MKGVNFFLRLTVKAEDNSDRLASSLTLTETEHTFRNLTPGRYTLTVRAVNTQGQQGEPASTDFSIAAPAVPSYVELIPGYFQITATPRQAVYDPTVQYEFWFTDTQITDIRQVESDARYLGTALYWIAANASIKPGKDYYFYRQKSPPIRYRKRRRKREFRHSQQQEVPEVLLQQHKQRVNMPVMQPHLKFQRVKAPLRPRRRQNRVITARQLQC